MPGQANSSNYQANQAALDQSTYSNGKDKGGGSEFLALDMGNQPQTSNQYMQMQLMDGGGDQAYVQQRSSAIESIESTISELGQIFSQLAHMVAEQRETVQRIDDDVHDVADNVSGAQRELLKYYASVSSNRWLMLKIFGVGIGLRFRAFLLLMRLSPTLFACPNRSSSCSFSCSSLSVDEKSSQDRCCLHTIITYSRVLTFHREGKLQSFLHLF